MVNRIKDIWLVFIFCVLANSCQKNSYEVKDGLEYIAVQTESNGKWSMMGSDGNLLFTGEFKHEPSLVNDGLFSVKEGDYFSLYSVSPKLSLINGCDDLVSVGIFKDGLIPLTHEGSRITIVNGNGELIGTLDPVDGQEIIGCSPSCGDGLFAIYDESNKYGYADPSGNVVIKPMFEDANIFSDELALVKTNINGELRDVVIDKNGKEVFCLRKDITPEASSFLYGLLMAKNSDDTWGFIDKNGIFSKAKGSVKRIEDFDDKSFVFMNDDYLWGVMAMNGDMLIRPKYGSVKYLPDGKYLVKADEAYLILNENGDKVRSIDGYKYVEPLIMGKVFFLSKENSEYKLLDEEGKTIGNHPIYGIAKNEGTRKFVITDYFNYESLLDSFVGQLTDKGYDKYSINTPIISLGIEDYESSVNNIGYSIKELTKSGWEYQIKVELKADELIAIWDYDGYDQKIILNPDARIESLNISLICSKPCWKELKEGLISAIQSKGYSLENQTDSRLSFRGKNCGVIVSSSVSGESINLRVERFEPTSQDNHVLGRAKDRKSTTENKLSSYNAKFFRGDTGYRTTRSGLKYVTVVEGRGSTPQSTDNVCMHYTVRLPNGSVFDTSLDTNTPPVFPVKSLIKGCVEGLQLMKVGGVSVFYIPSELAYGVTGAPGTAIGPNTDLIFEIQLIGIE